LSRSRIAARRLLVGLAVLGLAACQRTPPTEEAPQDAAKGGEGVTLSAEQVQKLGVATQPAQSFDYTPEITGYGVVIPHDSIATALAELTVAQAADAQSRAVSERAQRLAGTSGALAADTVESATRQAASDSAALELARRRLATVIGEGIPDGIAAPTALLQDLGRGKVKLLRATFPLGEIAGEPPQSLRAARLDAGVSWTVHQIWSAPADPALPGRSFFGLLRLTDSGEGERLLVWAPGTQPAQRGVTIPAASVVISDGKYWCYVAQGPGHYVRREVTTDKTVAGGYFVTAGIAAGEQVVTAQAALLLARENNPSTESD
jgi:hypothetical protein